MTGKLADDFGDLVAGLEQLGSYPRGGCRSAVEQGFTHLRMAREHEFLYRRVLDDDTTWPTP